MARMLRCVNRGWEQDRRLRGSSGKKRQTYFVTSVGPGSLRHHPHWTLASIGERKAQIRSHRYCLARIHRCSLCLKLPKGLAVDSRRQAKDDTKTLKRVATNQFRQQKTKSCNEKKRSGRNDWLLAGDVGRVVPSTSAKKLKSAKGALKGKVRRPRPRICTGPKWATT